MCHVTIIKSPGSSAPTARVDHLNNLPSPVQPINNIFSNVLQVGEFAQQKLNVWENTQLISLEAIKKLQSIRQNAHQPCYSKRKAVGMR